MPSTRSARTRPPIRLACSRGRRSSLAASVRAHARPAVPPPTTITSCCSLIVASVALPVPDEAGTIRSRGLRRWVRAGRGSSPASMSGCSKVNPRGEQFRRGHALPQPQHLLTHLAERCLDGEARERKRRRAVKGPAQRLGQLEVRHRPGSSDASRPVERLRRERTGRRRPHRRGRPSSTRAVRCRLCRRLRA